MCYYFMFLLFNIMEPIFPIKSLSFRRMLRSFWNKPVLPFCGFVIQEDVAKFFKQICPFCFGLLDFSWILLDDNHERVDESKDLWGFQNQFINAENGGKWVIFWKNTYSLKIIHRNCAFKSHCPSIGILIK